MVGGLRRAGGIGLGVCALAVALCPSVQASAAPGIDISDAQHSRHATINWQRLSKFGYRFAAIKVAEGDYYRNPYYRSDARAAIRSGLYVMPYTFANPHASGGARQARYAVRAIGYHRTARRMVLPLEVDLEYDPYARKQHVNACYGLKPAKMVRWIGAFVGQVRRMTGVRPVIYTSRNWWNTCAGGSRSFRRDPLWLAEYSTKHPKPPAAWPTWTFWQYAKAAKVRGITAQAGTDLDYFTPALQKVPDSAPDIASLNSLACAANQPWMASCDGVDAASTPSSGVDEASMPFRSPPLP